MDTPSHQPAVSRNSAFILILDTLKSFLINFLNIFWLIYISLRQNYQIASNLNTYITLKSASILILISNYISTFTWTVIWITVPNSTLLKASYVNLTTTQPSFAPQSRPRRLINIASISTDKSLQIEIPS